MIEFILNDQHISTDQPGGMALLDFIRHHIHLKGSKLVCKEGECGACTVLVGKYSSKGVEYISMTSCITPLINAHQKHIVTIEGLYHNELNPVQRSMATSYGTQCGFCTPGFVVSLCGYLLTSKSYNIDGIIEAIDGNICRCTGYVSIKRAAKKIINDIESITTSSDTKDLLIKHGYIPQYFSGIQDRLQKIPDKIYTPTSTTMVGGGTDIFVQTPRNMYDSSPINMFHNSILNFIEIKDNRCFFGASCTMGQLYKSHEFKSALPDSDYIFKLLSSTQIRNMATIGGNIANASPIGDFSVLLLGLDSYITLDNHDRKRRIPLKNFFLDYKKVDLQKDEYIYGFDFELPTKNTYRRFEKVSQRKFLDIASVNFASTLILGPDSTILEIHLAVGGVGPIPCYLHQTCELLTGVPLTLDSIDQGLEMLNKEISPISDTRGSAVYKRMLARQLYLAQFEAVLEDDYPYEKWQAS